MLENTFYPLSISEVWQETDSSMGVGFVVPEHLRERFHFSAGQYLTLEHTIDGQKLRRSYSICSATHHETLKVAIKRVRNGRFSNYANDHFQVGDTVQVMPPQGKFTPIRPIKGNSKEATHTMCIAVGSGITPILSIIQTLLHSNPLDQVTLIYGNRRSSSVMFKETLGFLKNRYIQRFKWINIMSEEDQGCDLLNGRIDNEKGMALHKAKLIDLLQADEMFICGPESMSAEVSRGFRYLGFDEERIHYELFSNSAEDSEQVLTKTKQRLEKYGTEKISQVTVVANARSIRFSLATTSKNILDAGLQQGLELPYACKAGVCSTCKAKLIKGKVEMDLTHGLEEEEIKTGYILCCQAHPISEDVVIDFDQR